MDDADDVGHSDKDDEDNVDDIDGDCIEEGTSIEKKEQNKGHRTVLFSASFCQVCNYFPRNFHHLLFR